MTFDPYDLVRKYTYLTGGLVDKPFEDKTIMQGVIKVNEICLCGHYKYAHNYSQKECNVPMCVCKQYKQLHPDIETVLKEKNEAIDSLVKEHVGMRKEIDLARGRLLYGRDENGLNAELCRDTLSRMDKIRHEYIQSNNNPGDKST